VAEEVCHRGKAPAMCASYHRVSSRRAVIASNVPATMGTKVNFHAEATATDWVFLTMRWT